MVARAPSALFVLAAAAASGCWSGEPSQLADGEEFVVHSVGKDPSVQFIRGKLPGKRPLTTPAPEPTTTPDGGEAPGAAGPSLPEIVQLGQPPALVAGQGGFGVTGNTTPEAYSVGLALSKVSTGYWVVPVQAPNDPQTNDPFWQVTVDFGPDIEPGFRDLLAVAFDKNGNPGHQLAKSVCISTAVPDNFNACRSSQPPPSAVISLSWDTNADVDLQVRTPDGLLIEPKHPAGARPNDAGVIPTDAPAIDRDANAGCVASGLRRESLVWPSTITPPQGHYGIYVNLFDACKQSIVHFIVEVYSVIPNPDGGAGTPVKKLTRAGELLDVQANGGSARGLFVTDFNFK
jgi:hypothetical protein